MCWVMPPASVGGDVGVADGVEHGGLAVVDVTHDHNHRGCAAADPRRRVLAVVDDAFLDGDNHLALDNLAPHFRGDDSGGVIVDDIRDGGHDA